MSITGSTRTLSLICRAVRAASQWRLLLLWILLVFIPTLLLLLPIWRVVADQLDYSVHAAEWTREWNLVVISDLGERLTGAAGALADSEYGAGVVFFALTPLLNGLFIAASRTASTATLGELLRGALQEYGRMLRMMFMAVVPLGIALGLGFAAFKGVQRYGEHAIFKSAATHARGAAFAFSGLLVVYANASVDAGRAYLALHPGKRSVIKAWWRGLTLVLAHPRSAFGPYLLITLGAVLALAAASWLRVELPSASVPGLVLGFLTTQLIVAIMACMHFARLYALLEVTQVSGLHVPAVGESLH